MRWVSFTSAVALAALSCGLAPAWAGDNNTLRVIQESPLGGPGNVLYVDQSLASNSLVLGPGSDLVDKVKGLEGRINDEVTDKLSLDLLTTRRDDLSSQARQSGSGNDASITMRDYGGEMQLLQDGSANHTTITASGPDALGAVLQIGNGNNATLTVDGGKGLIAQHGDYNNGSLSVESGGSGKLVQNGDGNNYPLSVEQNTSVTVVQNGNGLQPVGVAGMQVFSTNPGTITITQTGF